MSSARFLTLTFAFSDEIPVDWLRLGNFIEALDREVCRGGAATLMGEGLHDKTRDVFTVEVFKTADIGTVNKSIKRLLAKHHLSPHCQVTRHAKTST